MREGRSALADADFVIQRRLRLVVPDALTNRGVFAFAGLADNEQFFASLRTNGFDVVGSRSFRDHHRYTAADVASVKEAARRAGVQAIVTTEKDAVKIDDRDIIAIAAEMIIEPEILSRISGLVDQEPRYYPQWP